ncbi:uncharacterized protein LOC124191929 [Daphnia pulex]|uniref:Putative eclosion triggering hormone preprohormone n=1 Tax=Daphnia pulex TaxID=6669 RepID=E9H4H6_DAPPU|nr:uncharacterized protein LOC124191929 [Daphnia pulex]XP_046648207.1 uncharacterized protein LOC124338178 [Daphnia pulicaria]EFX73380.1 putative eclosion triggering hormone preprohormone [Daphnia pulex]|eukprot:EFX73380.1 putative eclosion triggering hormone preprohormone [Daphnia pulex]
MYRELIMIKGLFLTWLLLASALSDPSPEPFNPNYNRFRQKIPRIGRRGEGIIAEYMNSESFPHEGSLSNFFLKASKAVPRLGRRKDISTESGRAAMVGEEPFGRISNEIPIMNQKQDLWPNMNINELTGALNKELNYPGPRIPKDLQDNYIQDLIHSWINQYENLNEN